MPTLSALYTYPIKSAARLEHDQLPIGTTGPVFDRRWMVVFDGETPYNSISQRELPKLAVVQPRIHEDHMHLSAPGMPDIRVPLAETGGELLPALILDTFPTHALDMGDEAAAWFSRLLETPARLMRMPDAEVRLISMDYTNEPAQTSMTDGYPLLIISQASLDALNEQLIARGQPAADMNRFRPNLVVAGTEPFEEDIWKRIRINGIEFEVAKPCARCKITTVDQATGTIPDVHEPLATLATFRRWPNGKLMFGQNLIHRGLGTLERGAVVEVLK